MTDTHSSLAELSDASVAAEHAQMDRVWRSQPGLWGWLTTVNHKDIGRRYITTAFIFFLLGGLEAAMMRAQLSRPENGLIGPDSNRSRPRLS